MKASLGPNELGGVASGLVKAVPQLAQLEAEQVPFYTQTDQFNKCLTNVLIPAGNTKLQDGNATSGVEAYKEFWYSLVGLNGIGQSFDGNGTRTKFLVGNSGQTLRSQPDLDPRQHGEGQPAADALAADAARHAPGVPHRRAPVPAESALLQAGAAGIQRPALERTRGREPADGARAHSSTRTRAAAASATRSSATARPSSRW